MLTPSSYDKHWDAYWYLEYRHKEVDVTLASLLNMLLVSKYAIREQRQCLATHGGQSFILESRCKCWAKPSLYLTTLGLSISGCQLERML